ncbi:helix-turn-helix transcriptional regulator [Pseudomonas putida]|uniref:helix-turn-helix transcriptional regulator n=1 Tax=Pseudomonas putida TaxID=303 RepID=UPI00300EBA9B
MIRYMRNYNASLSLRLEQRAAKETLLLEYPDPAGSVKNQAVEQWMVHASRAVPPGGFKAQVQSQIIALLPTHRCTLEQVALALDLNPRTLQRRLADEATDFEQCLDHIRRSQAQQMLRKTCLSVARISAELGYRRATSFCRAHLRWFKMTPLEHRREFGDKALLMG